MFWRQFFDANSLLSCSVLMWRTCCVNCWREELFLLLRGGGGWDQVRDNILFGCAYDARRYEMVLDACALKSVSAFCVSFIFNVSTFPLFLFAVVVVLIFQRIPAEACSYTFKVKDNFLPEGTGQIIWCPEHAWGQKRRFCSFCVPVLESLPFGRGGYCNIIELCTYW